jgi:hypothetical protein
VNPQQLGEQPRRIPFGETAQASQALSFKRSL